MEAVAVPAMNFAFKSAAIAITDEIGLLSGVTEELFFLTKEYEMMQAVLRAASTENVKGEVMTTWILQVRELASDVDNCLQEASVLQMKKEVKKGTNGGVMISELAVVAAGGFTMSELILVPGSRIS
ncbi:uncharacterized protein LOC144556399 isoform X2 [Carex rostrata]